jgi:phosphatidylglycerol lysyltransferase
MKKTWLKILGWVFILAVFSMALSSIYGELRAYKLTEILDEIHQISFFKIFFALAATLLSYLALTGYDFLGIKYANCNLPYRKLAFTSFLSYIFSNNIGMSVLSGGAVRFRLYSSQGLSTVEIVKVIGFCLLTFWIGLISSASFFMISTPIDLPSMIHLPFSTTRPLGFLFIALFAIYLLLVLFRKKPIIFLGNEFQLPSPKLVPLQLIFSILDWTMIGLALYVLIPSELNITFPAFLGLFILAQALAIMSTVPGGVGVFESLILLFFSGRIESSQLFSSLLLYRLVYYLLPLIMGLLIFFIREIYENRKMAGRVLESISSRMSPLFPVALSILTFIGGGILIFSGTIPSLPERMEWIKIFIPFPIVEASHFLGSLSGLLLMILSLGILNRTQPSYYLTLIFFLMGGIFSLLKGFDYEEAMVLFVFFLLLLPCRRYFYRKARISMDIFSFSWVILVSIVIISSFYLGFFSYKHVEYSHDLWLKFEFHSDAPRFMRASVGMVIALLSSSVFFLIRTKRLKPSLPETGDLAEIPELILKWGETSASLVYLGDKHFLFHKADDEAKPDGFLMYGISGKTWVSMGDPIGSEEVVRDLIWQFRQETHHNDYRAIFYEIGQQFLPYYIELGFSLLKIGEDAIVDLDSFSLKGSKRSAMRNIISRFDRDGYHFEILNQEQTLTVLPELKLISDSWLEEKKVREKGFSLGFFNEEYLGHFRTAVVRNPEGKIMAFSNLWESHERKRVSVDLMRYLKDSPSSLMDYLFLQIILMCQEEGYKSFDLGMAPFSGLPSGALSPFWNRLGSALYKHGEDFYNFQGLRKYKNKFHPKWEPRYIAVQGGLSLPRTLMDLTALINGGILGTITK